jgi:DNA repair protein RecO (recombination protein O)
MPIYEDEAIVLRQYPLADSDCIVVSIGPELGKIRAVGQGIKKPKSRLAGCLEPLNHVRISVYAREGSDLGKIRHAEMIHPYSGKIDSLDHIFTLAYFTELVHTLVQDNQANPLLFRLMLASLKAGEKRVPVHPFVRYFEVWCLKISGLYGNYAYCSDCGKYVKEEGFFARIMDGIALCGACAAKKDCYIDAASSRALQAMMTRSPEDFSTMPITRESCEQIGKLTQGLLAMHVDGPLKSYRILREVLA